MASRHALPLLALLALPMTAAVAEIDPPTLTQIASPAPVYGALARRVTKTGETVCVEGLGCWDGATGQQVAQGVPAPPLHVMLTYRQAVQDMPRSASSTPWAAQPVWFGSGVTGGSIRPPETVPEPGVFWLLLTGVAAMLWRRR